MPELPEVETIRLQLEKYLVGHGIESVEVRNERIFTGDKNRILGARVINTRRFGKALVIDLDNGFSILAHVKMTGQFIYQGPNLKPRPLSKKVTGGVPGKHTHVIFTLDNDGKLYYNDMRQFGWIKVEPTDQVENEKFISSLGPEFFKDLDLATFRNILSKTRRSIKVLLMDQSKMAGVGNIYANDALWDAKINPKRPANAINYEESEMLFNSIEKVLKKGLETGGASENAFVTPNGSEGDYQNHSLVYAKQGQKCSRSACRQKGAKIEKFTLGGRGTFWCPACQK